MKHLTSFCIFHAKESYDWLASPLLTLPSLIRWHLFGTGPMTTNVSPSSPPPSSSSNESLIPLQAAEAAAFIRLDRTKHLWESPSPSPSSNNLPESASVTLTDTTSGPNAPDIEIIGVPLHSFRHGLVGVPPGCKSYTMVPVALHRRKWIGEKELMGHFA